MASPKRDQMNPGAGKMLDDGDVVVDLTAVVKKLDAVLSAVTGLKVDATIETGDIEIGAVELKNATDDQRASIEAANTARTTATKVLAVQPIDAAGNVLGRDAANTARTTGTLVTPTQQVDPAGNTITLDTVGADATSNTMNRTPVMSWLKAFNGTTWDRLRAGLTTISATLTGFLNTLPWGVYHATPIARTDGQGGPMEQDSNGNILTSLGTYIEGEDAINHVMKTEVQMNYTNISASALIKTGAGRFAGFIVNSAAAGATIKFWDNTSAATTVLLNTITYTAAVNQGPSVVLMPAEAKFATGLYCTIAVAAMDVTILWA